MLVGSEAQHVAKVMRAGVGDALVLFDGSGSEFDATITALSRQTVELEVIARREVDREASRAIHIGVALPKGDRQQFLIEKLTELGVAGITPLVCERSVAQPVEAALARIERWVIEASKQCGRNRLMQVTPPQRWSEFVSMPTDAMRLVAHPGETPLAALGSQQTGPVIVAVGPEGGLTDGEVALARKQGWQPVSLGPRILRVETAAIALATLLGAAEPIDE